MTPVVADPVRVVVEDAGMGLPLGPMLFHRDVNATPSGECMMACHACVCSFLRPRTASVPSKADWFAARIALCEAGRGPGLRPLCAHPRRSGTGARSGAAVGQRRSGGDELPSADHRYR